jgi:hypothetical protein
MENEALESDLKALAEIIFELSEKYGGIYVTANRSVGLNNASAWADVSGQNYISVTHHPKQEEK